MTRLAVLLLLGLIGLSSCAPGLGRWTKPGIGQAELDRDTYECRREATYSSVGGAYTATWTHRLVDLDLYALCMRARGYQRTK